MMVCTFSSYVQAFGIGAGVALVLAGVCYYFINRQFAKG